MVIGHTQIGKTSLYGTPYTINERSADYKFKDDGDGYGVGRTVSKTTITLTTVSIPADGENPGASWSACMAQRGFQVRGAVPSGI